MAWALEKFSVRDAPTTLLLPRATLGRAPIPRGTALGAYPGRVRTSDEMQRKALAAPLAKQYAFRTSDGRYLDPTDAQGQPSARPAPGWPWLLATPPLLAYANEPPRGAGGTNVFVEDGATPELLLFVANRDIGAGEEVFIDYGLTYDRSDYGA